MAGQTVRTGETLVAGIRGDFWNTYHESREGVLGQLADVMLLNVPSDKREEIYGMRKTMPYPELWRYGDPIPEEGTDSLQFTVPNFRYAKRINWQRDDRMDNQVGDLGAEARTAASNFAQIPSRMQAEVMNGQRDLLPFLPNAPDGAPMYANLDGSGAPRFGVTNGNLLTGLPLATTQNVLDAFFAGIIQISQFLNSKGQPYFSPDLLSERYVVYAAVTDAQVIADAFSSQIVHSETATPTGAGVSNVILSSGVPVRFNFSTRFSAGNLQIFRADAPVKATFYQSREGVRESNATEENSDLARSSGTEYVQFVERGALGLNVPFATVKTTTS